MDDAADTFVEVPLLRHDKEEDVPSMILQPKQRKRQREKAKQPRGAKRKLDCDEKENRILPGTKKLKGLSAEDGGLKLDAGGRIAVGLEEASFDSGDASQKMIKLELLQDKKCATTPDSVAPKRATRKQKRVQLTQLISCPQTMVDTESEVKRMGESRSGSQTLEKLCQRPAFKPKLKQRSVKFLLNATDHIWAQTKEVQPEQPNQEWRQINAELINPSELIGRSCKVFWPLDQSWYAGAVREYSSVSRKHRIDYADNQTEWLCLVKEKVQFQMSMEEEKTLWTSSSTSNAGGSLDVDELVLLANELDSCEGQIGHGTVVWAKVKGWPVWPAIVLDDDHAAKCGLEPYRKSSFAVQFFGSCDFARLNTDKVVAFAKGVQQKYHTKCKRPAFGQGLKEVESYLKHGRLPEKMAQMVEMQSRSKSGAVKDTETSDSEEFIGDEREHPTKTSMLDLLGCPLDLGDLKILSLGKIVADSEHFHEKHYIWPEGYVSVRPFPSLKDPDKLVDYRMEVTRDSSTPSLPLFRIVPADSDPLEGSTPGDCWQKVYKISRSMKKLKRKSGISMFGFDNPRVFKLIQRLPNAQACTNFCDWDIDDEHCLAGYKPIELQWKHSERCNVCYRDEEYDDNLLLQCAKCRLMVHMSCYGVSEPQGDGFWLCQLCERNTTKRPSCCLCPVAGGAMKRTTDGRWSHLTCAMWIPETCIKDIKKMEPVDGLSSVHKERWKLQCCICGIPYGACIQCTHSQCLTAYHPLCARAAGLCMEVKEDGPGLRLLSFCLRHRTDAGYREKNVCSPGQDTELVSGPSGCSRCEPYISKHRRRRQEPEGQARAVSRRTFVEKTPYSVGSLRRSSNSCQWRLIKVDKVYKSIPQGPVAVPSSQTAELVSMSTRLECMRSTLHFRLTFGKSGIHGWGIFCKQAHQLGDMIVEYAGEIVRPIVADLREQRHYNTLVGAGTYIFAIDEHRVVDATRAGSFAHLINHSCEPNCYSRIITVNRNDLIIIFAKRDIAAGEELTYDYRFTSKGEELVCNCGATNCRGSVRRSDDGEGGSRVLAPRSLLT